MEFRAITRPELGPFLDNLSVTFGRDSRPEMNDHLVDYFEFDRSLAAFDGEVMVGTSAAVSQRLRVPGGVVGAGGLTMVSVRPTHRRAGILTRMMEAHVADCRGRGEPVSMLWASESSIYRRFGYGEATFATTLEIEVPHGSFADPMPVSGRVRMMGTEEIGKLVPPVYDRAASRPGMLERDPRWWEAYVFWDPEFWRDGASAQRWAIYEEGGVAEGYVAYRQRSNWSDRGFPEFTVEVDELIGSTPAAYRGLWAFIFGIDLTQVVRARVRPLDEPLQWMLAEPRRLVRARVGDGLWVRLVDIEAALGARHYRLDDNLILEVEDPFIATNSGRYRVRGGPGGAECVRTDDSPDVTLDVADLGRLYLGGGSVSALAYAGGVRGSAEALRRFDLMFGWHESPWCPEMF